MIICKQAERYSAILRRRAAEGRTIGFVPTMGALHEGHLALVRQSLDATNLTSVSIFVNPTQFNDPRDFERYPITLEKDIQLLEAAGTDLLFLPSVAEMYPNGMQGLEHYDLGYLETLLEGAYRPGHFQGVCQVVNRLLAATEPHQLFMGRKDYQQCMVIRQLLALTGRKTELVTCDTLREPDGLAMSSRNMRLDAQQRNIAPTLFRVLQEINVSIRPGPLDALLQHGKNELTESGFRVDYLAVCKADDLSPVDHWDGHTPLVALVAAYLGAVRLIDNMPVGV